MGVWLQKWIPIIPFFKILNVILKEYCSKINKKSLNTNDFSVNIIQKYNRDYSLAFYDLTNYYLEIEKEGELKKTDISKEQKTPSIV